MIDITYDRVEKFGKSIIQHGKYNDRAYLMKLHPNDEETIIDQIDYLVNKYSYTKVFAKIPSDFDYLFFNHGYKKEAKITGLYNGEANASFMGKFFSNARASHKNRDKKIITEIFALAKSKQFNSKISDTPDGFTVQELNKSDAIELSELYKKVFRTYPFPIHDPEYISKTMDENIIYFGFFNNGNLIAASSSEIDINDQSAEMTDFATHHDFRGFGLALILLDKMENRMKEIGIKNCYTIARALSFGMNITFSKKGYNYSGTLVNNTNISGKIESMNVWYKLIVGF
ncbi:MAG: putative beta-lysine N-acetyltransferase [Methanosarcinales archaeon]